MKTRNNFFITDIVLKTSSKGNSVPTVTRNNRHVLYSHKVCVIDLSDLHNISTFCLGDENVSIKELLL